MQRHIGILIISPQIPTIVAPPLRHGGADNSENGPRGFDAPPHEGGGGGSVTHAAANHLLRQEKQLVVFDSVGYSVPRSSSSNRWKMLKFILFFNTDSQKWIPTLTSIPCRIRVFAFCLQLQVWEKYEVSEIERGGFYRADRREWKSGWLNF